MDGDEHTDRQFVVRVLQAYPHLDAGPRRLVDRILAAELDDREQALIHLRFGHDRDGSLRTLEEVARILRIDRETTLMMEARAFQRLADPDLEWSALIDLLSITFTWQQHAEALLLQLERLETERDLLEDLLASALEDARLARARVEHLRELNSMLRRELYETGSPDRRWTRGIAGLVLGLTVGILSGVGQAGGEVLMSRLLDTQEASRLVIIACGPDDTDSADGQGLPKAPR